MSNSTCSTSTKDESNGFSGNSPSQTRKIVHVRHAGPNVSCTTAISLDPALYLFPQVFQCSDCVWVFRTSRLGCRNDKALSEANERLTGAACAELLPAARREYVDEPMVDSVAFDQKNAKSETFDKP